MEAPVFGMAAQPLFTFRGSLSTLFKIHLTNVILTILTLGVYRFWAKTRMRRYLWSRLEVAGDPLEYTGTAKELFLGFLIVFGAIILPLFVLPSAILPFIAADYPWLETVIGSIQGLAFMLLLPVAVYRARRYRLSRTRWRGIRGAQSGSAATYANKFLLYGGLQLVTLGLTTPVVNARLAHYVLTNTRIGDQPLSFAGQARPMYPRLFQALGWYVLVLVCLAAVIVLAALASLLSGTIAISIAGVGAVLISSYIARAWYSGAELVYFTSQTSFDGLHLTLAMTPWQYAWLSLGNTLIFLFTLGLGMPWVYKRSLDFAAARLRVRGDVAAVVIRQSSAPSPRLGEGLADAFDASGF